MAAGDTVKGLTFQGITKNSFKGVQINEKRTRIPDLKLLPFQFNQTCDNLLHWLMSTVYWCVASILKASRKFILKTKQNKNIHLCMGFVCNTCIIFKYRRGLIIDDVIKWKHLPRYWPFVRGIHQSPVNSPHKGQWRGALMGFFFICAWIPRLSKPIVRLVIWDAMTPIMTSV